MTLSKKILLYLASGPYKADYEDLPFEQVILVDRLSNKEVIPDDSKVEYWRMDALNAIDEISRRKLKIDCLVSLNDGMFEGGGSYPIFSEFLLGYLHPHLSDDLLVITDLNYYKSLRISKIIGKMDWGFTSSVVRSNNDDFINPLIFSYGMTLENCKHIDDFGNVFKLKRDKKIYSNKIHAHQISTRHTSIWEDEDELDFIGLSMPTDNIASHRRSFGRNEWNFFNQKEKVYSIRNLSFQEVINLAIKKGAKTIGLLPWLNGNYSEVLQVLRDINVEGVLDIRFYHLQKQDLEKIRQSLSSYFFSIYSTLFETINNVNEESVNFQEVLDNGFGSEIVQLCSVIINENSKYSSRKPVVFKKIELNKNKLQIHLNHYDNKTINKLVDKLNGRNWSNLIWYC
jgi:hypothetical protein